MSYVLTVQAHALAPVCLANHVILLDQVNTARRQLGMRIFGFDAPKPVQTFAQCGFDALVMAAVKKAGQVPRSPLCDVEHLN